MGEEQIELTSGYLYILSPDDQWEPLGTVTTSEISYSDDYDIPEYIAQVTGLEATFESLAKVSKDLILKLFGVYDAIVQICPNKLVVHLTLNGRTHKIRKKNLHRAIKILEGM